MALIKCSECGKEISDQAASCPNCGCPIKKVNSDSGEDNSEKKIEISIKKPDIKLNKRTKGILGGVIVCLVILIGVIIYTKTTITITDQENALLLSINEIRDGLLAPDSFIAYEAKTTCLDPEYVQLDYDYPIPEIFNKDIILTYVHSGGQNKSGGITDDYQIFAYDLDGNLIDTYASDDGDGIIINHTAYGAVFSEPEYYLQDVANMMVMFDESDAVKNYDKDEISELIDKTAGKKLKIKSTFYKHTDEEKQNFLDIKIDSAVENGDIDYLNNALNMTTSDEQKTKIQEKIDKYYYDKGCEALESEEYEDARKYFAQDNDYEDTETQIKRSYYEEAESIPLYRTSTEHLIDLYENAGDYSNAEDMVTELKDKDEYDNALEAMKNAEFDVALDYWNDHPGEEADEYKKLIEEAQKWPYNGYWVGKHDGKNSYMKLTAYVTSNKEVLYYVNRDFSLEKVKDMETGLVYSYYDENRIRYYSFNSVSIEIEFLSQDKLVSRSVSVYRGKDEIVESMDVTFTRDTSISD